MTTVEQGGLRGRREVRGGGTSGYGRTGTARSIDDARSRGREALAAARGANSLALDPLDDESLTGDAPRGAARGRGVDAPGRGSRDDRGSRGAPADGYDDDAYVEVVDDTPRGRAAEARRRAADSRGRAPEGRGARDGAVDRANRRTSGAGRSDVDGGPRPGPRGSDVDGGPRARGRRSDVDGAAPVRGRRSDVDSGARSGAGRAGAVDRAAWDRDGLRRTPVDRRTGRTDRAADRVVDLAGESRRRVIDLAADRRRRSTEPVGDERPVGRLRDRAGREAEELAGREAARLADRESTGRLRGRSDTGRIDAERTAGRTGSDRTAAGRTGAGRAESGRAESGRSESARSESGRSAAGRADSRRGGAGLFDERPGARLRDRAGREAEALAGREASRATGARGGREAAASAGRSEGERRGTRARGTGDPRPGVRNRRDVGAGDKRGAGAEAVVVGNLALDAVPARSAEPAPAHGGILGVVPPAPVTAPRVPFISLVLAVVVAGVFGILVINTKINENAFKLHEARANQADLDRNEERLRGEIAMLESPNSLAAAARRMGMVPAPTPAYLKLPNGQQIGVPQPAGGAAG